MELTKETNVLDIIIALVKAIKETKEPDEKNCRYYLEDGKNRLWGAKYLLNQVLRQYRINDDHIFISIAADKLWKEITDGKVEIKNYNYTMQIPVHKECTLDLYKGAANIPFEKAKTLKPSDTFQYRQVFHDEHVIPIEMIIKKLEGEKNLTYENVQKILDNIYMCRMLKSENIELNKGNRNTREWDVKKTIEEIYNEKHHIEIVDWEEIKNKL